MLSDRDQSIPFLAWRSLIGSILIAIVGTLLYSVALNELTAAIEGQPLSPGESFLVSFFGRYGVSIPVCIGGLFLALRVRHRWILNSSVYIGIYVLIALIRYLGVGFGIQMALQFCIPIVACYPIVLLLRVLVVAVFGKSPFFSSSPEERIVFGIPTLFWITALVGFVIYLATWAGNTHDRRLSAQNLEFLVEQGADYNEPTKRLSINGNQYQKKPVRIGDVISIIPVVDDIVVEFINCEITDEAVAMLKKSRERLGKVNFTNCTVVKEARPSGLVDIGNEANKPLPSELP